MKEIYYIYPKFQFGSFHNISVEHINRLRKRIKVQEIDKNTLDNICWAEGKRTLLHPVGYILLGDSIYKIEQKKKRLQVLRSVSRNLGGFDTADSSQISDIFVKVLNKLDLVIVPSTWAKDVYEKSGVETDVRVLPHGIPDAFLEQPETEFIPANKAIAELIEIKQKNRAKLVLFFLMHSGYRKGADLVAKVMREIQKNHKNVYLVVKTHNVLDPFFSHFKELKMINVRGWFNEIELRQLYDVCDVIVCPSRGGGFELNALEGIARGKPTLFTDAMCFEDYRDFGIPIKIEKEVKVLPGNPLHTGVGYEVSISDFVSKLEKVIRRYYYYKQKALRASRKVRKLYSWDKIVNDLFDMLVESGFV